MGIRRGRDGRHRQPGYSRQAANTAPAPPAKAAPATPAMNASVASDDGIDTLDTIAASLALETTNDGLRRRALFSLKALATPGDAVTPHNARPSPF